MPQNPDRAEGKAPKRRRRIGEVPGTGSVKKDAFQAANETRGFGDEVLGDLGELGLAPGTRIARGADVDNLLKPIKEPMDAAEQWLRDNDPLRRKQR